MANPEATLESLGLDSLMAAEIAQALEQHLGIHMTAVEIRALTFAKLDQMSTSPPSPSASTASVAPPTLSIRFEPGHLAPTEAVVQMNHVDTGAAPLFLIHPIDGSVLLPGSVMSKIRAAKVYGFQCTSDTPLTTIPDLASHYIKVSFRYCPLIVLITSRFMKLCKGIQGGPKKPGPLYIFSNI